MHLLGAEVAAGAALAKQISTRCAGASSSAVLQSLLQGGIHGCGSRGQRHRWGQLFSTVPINETVGIPLQPGNDVGSPSLESLMVGVLPAWTSQNRLRDIATSS